MKVARVVSALGVALVLVMGAGCQPWQEKYETCVTEKDNLEGLFEGCQQGREQCESDLDRLNQELMSARAKLDELGTRPKSGLEDEGGVYDPAKGTITVTLESDILFDSGKANLKSTYKSKLNRIAQIIQREHANKQVSVVGHTDTDPIKKSKWKDNWQLSTERALAVVRHMVSQGIPSKNLAAVGRGEYHPVGSSKAQNRRVEIVVHLFE